MSKAYDEAIQPVRQDVEPSSVLEPAVLPAFGAALRGYDRREVDTYIDYQRRRLAAMRARAQRAERALAGAGSGDLLPVERPGAPVQPTRGPAVQLLASSASASVSTAGPQGPRRHLRAGEAPRAARLHQLARYGACSLVSILITEALLALVYGDLRLGSAVACSILASAAAAVPTFFLYRSWVWRLPGRSRLRSEVIPFWIVTAAGILLSTLGVAAVTAFVPRGAFHGHLTRAAVVDGASLASFGLLWVARFFVLDRFVFRLARSVAR